MSFGPARHELQEASWRGGPSDLSLVSVAAGVLLVGLLIGSVSWWVSPLFCGPGQCAPADATVSVAGGVLP